jgi:hypothetical protein
MTSDIATTATTEPARARQDHDARQVRYVLPESSAYGYTVKPHPPTPRQGPERR